MLNKNFCLEGNRVILVSVVSAFNKFEFVGCCYTCPWYHTITTNFQTTVQQQPPPSQPTPEPQALVNLANLKEATSSAPILPIAEDVEEEDAIIEGLQDEDQDMQEQEDIEMFLDSISLIPFSHFTIAKV